MIETITLRIGAYLVKKGERLLLGADSATLPGHRYQTRDAAAGR